MPGLGLVPGWRLAPQPLPQALQPAPRVVAALLRAQVQEQTQQQELQVRVLAAQLLRSHAAAQGVTGSIAPLLGGVEARLLALKARSHRTAAQEL